MRTPGFKSSWTEVVGDLVTFDLQLASEVRCSLVGLILYSVGPVL
jgi:flagellar biosynthesis regulator FlaF